MSEWISLARDGLSQHGVAILFVACLLENLAFTGVIIPGAVLLFAAGWLARGAGQSPADLAPLILAATLGTIIGDNLSYYVGRRLRRRVLASPALCRRVRAAARLVRRKPALLVGYHFMTYLRMSVPLAAGVIRVPWRRWLACDSPGALCWVLVCLGTGYLVPPADAETVSHVLAVVVALFFAGVLLKYRIKTRRQQRPQG
jgi:undecaprenyl-diphosphatase